MDEQSEQYNIVDTTATKRIFSLTKRIRAVKGGTSASKTISILIWCIDYCQSKQEREKLVTVTSETYPHLDKGAMLDFENIMKDRGYWNDARWNKTEHTYTFETGNKLEFATFDTYLKAHGPRRDVLFINEGNNMPWNIVDQLITRTREIIWIDWNPSTEFWFDIELLPHRKQDIDFITLTYKDNEALDSVSVAEIESHRHKKNWWKVYGEGQLGEIEGRIYTGWKIIDEIPHEARLERRGLDFGYSIDPAALLDIYYFNGGYIWDEQLYQKRMSNSRIADFILDLPSPELLVIADSAEPKSIDELYEYGINVRAAEKGKDSIRQGIQFIQDLPISITRRSVNLIKEYRNYMWATDRLGNTITPNVPEDVMNHLLDAGRYAQLSLKKRDPAEEERRRKQAAHNRDERRKAAEQSYGM